LIQRVYSVILGTHFLIGGVVDFPPQLLQGGSRAGGGMIIFVAPLAGERNINKNYLVKYYDFIVNHKVAYMTVEVIFRDFFLEGTLLYEGVLLWFCIIVNIVF
jgi:hypothetical protein